MRIALAVLMALHGIAHLVGFVGSWRLARLEGMTYETRVLSGRLDLGASGIRVLGVLWLVLAVGFLVVAVAGALGRGGWVTWAVILAFISLSLSLLQWPDSRIGVLVNLVILVAIVLGAWLRAF